MPDKIKMIGSGTVGGNIDPDQTTRAAKPVDDPDRFFRVLQMLQNLGKDDGIKALIVRTILGKDIAQLEGDRHARTEGG